MFRAVGWLGEVEGLEISLAGAEDELSQLDAALKPTVTHLGLPTFASIAGRTSSPAPDQP
ncbi:hypothetical protein ABZ341_33585 [Streptomyces sp. NPDC006173]|uniref:hypothetical protein n=1 Tax=Streptomyces sp. NPDC006173 TaxID=3155349 RepID=UPI0033D776E7